MITQIQYNCQVFNSKKFKMFLKCLLFPQRKKFNENGFSSTKWTKTSAMHFIFMKWNMRECCLLVSWGGKAKGQKQPFRCVLRKKCFENMQQIYKRKSMSKCDFNKVVLQSYWNQTSAWVFSCKFAVYFQNTFS